MIGRREFLLASAAAGLAPAAVAQTVGKVPIVGFVGLADRQSHKLDIEGFRHGLREQGYVAGRTILIDERYADGSVERYSEMIADMGGSGAPNAQAIQMSAKVGAAASVAGTVILSVLSMIWPILMIVLLTRPGSRAACLSASKGSSAEADVS